jgi:signal transduction histidine kinase
MPSGLAIADAPSGKLVLHNDEAVRLLRHPMHRASTYMGYGQFGALHADGTPYRPDEYPIARAARDGATVHQEDMIYRRGDNTLTVFSVNAAPIKNDAGDIIAAVSTFHDISERQQLLLREKATRAQAEQAVQERDEFLSVAAHELKTPITSLRGFVQLVLRQFSKGIYPDIEQLQHSFKTIDEKSIKLTQLINQLLDISRIHNGRLTLEIQHTDLCQIVQSVLFTLHIDENRHPIKLIAPEILPVMVDPLRIEQVVMNLVDNAVKYSPDGGLITIRLGKDHNSVCLSVTDSGIGIPSEYREKIFDRFYRADNHKHLSGMGLGLYISHQIVKLHGGNLSAEFPEGGGTRFIVSLPVSEASKDPR